jgi:hypothetical protein
MSDMEERVQLQQDILRLVAGHDFMIAASALAAVIVLLVARRAGYKDEATICRVIDDLLDVMKMQAKNITRMIERTPAQQQRDRQMQ